VHTRTQSGNKDDGRFRIRILDNAHIVKIHGEPQRVQVQPAKANRLPLQVCVELSLCITAQRLIHEKTESDSANDETSYAANEPNPPFPSHCQPFFLAWTPSSPNHPPSLRPKISAASRTPARRPTIFRATTATDRPNATPTIGSPMSNQDSKATMIPSRIAGNKAAKRPFLTLPALAPPTRPAMNRPMVGRKRPRTIDGPGIHRDAAATEPLRCRVICPP
jgi:hypothetical protein